MWRIGSLAQDSRFEVRAAASHDAEAIAEIFNHYIRESVITFEEEPVTVPEIARRIAEIQSMPLPWLIAAHGSKPIAYAYAARWKTRTAYRFSVEVTVYVTPQWVGCGAGSLLLSQLLPLLQAQRVHAAIGGVALPNEASVSLLEKFGFEKVAQFHQVGFKFDRWIDVGYWQRIL